MRRPIRWLADGTKNGQADPAFAAHEDLVGMWYEAVKGQWLPRVALERLAKAALAIVVEGALSWSKVCVFCVRPSSWLAGG